MTTPLSPEDRKQMQFDILWNIISDNELLPPSTVQTDNKQLNTDNKSVIKAINELLAKLQNNNATLANFNNIFNSLVGNPELDAQDWDNLKGIDTNIIKSIYKIYLDVLSLNAKVQELDQEVSQPKEDKSGYRIIMNGENTNQIMAADTSNEILQIEGGGLNSVEVAAKTFADGSRDTVKITSRFPTWDEITGDPTTVFSNKDFVLDGDTISISPIITKGASGGGGGGLPYINVSQFSVLEKDPTTGANISRTYCAKGTNDASTVTLADGTVVSDTLAFQMAFSLAQEKSSSFPGGLGSVNIYIPDGVYVLTDTIVLYRNTNVQVSRNAIIKKNHSGVMFCNTAEKDAYLGYDGGRWIKNGIKVDQSVDFTPNNGNIFFDGGTFDNDGTSGSIFSLINARNFEFKNLTVRDILDSHAFDIDGIADVIIYNCNFTGYDYRGSRNRILQGYTDEANIDPADIRAYSECIQIDYSTKEAFPAQDTGHDGTACKRIRVDKCYFGPSDRFPAWNRVYGGHNTYVPTYDWLYNADGSPKGNVYNFLDGKPTDIYFLNNVVDGNGTLKYDYDQNDSQGFIIQQVRLQCVDNAIVMNNKFRNIKGGISIDIDSSPKTMIPDDKYKNFVTTGTSTVPASGVMPAKVTYLDSHGDMKEILYTTNPADIDLTKVTTHTHNKITYTIYWCKVVKMVEYYGWKNAMIMNNEMTNVTSGIYSYKQVTITDSPASSSKTLVVQDIYDVLGKQVIVPGSEIYVTDPSGVDANNIPNDPNPKTVLSISGSAPYTITVSPSLSTAQMAGGIGVFIKNSPSKAASTPIYLRGKMSPYKSGTYTASTGVYKFTSGGQSDTYGRNAIIYGNIVDGCDQVGVYSAYSDVVLNGRKVTTIKTIDPTRTILTLSAVTDPYMLVGEILYYNGDFSAAYQIMSVNTTAKTVTIYPALDPSGVVGAYMWSRKPILAGQTGGPGIITAISAQWVNDVLIQKNIVRNVPRAVYVNGGVNINAVGGVTYTTPVGERTNILGNHFYQINEVEAVAVDTGNYVNIIGNTFSNLNDQAIEMRNANYFNISNNELLNFNKAPICQSPVETIDWQYNPLNTPVIEIHGDGVTNGQYGTVTGNMFVHHNSQPVATGVLADETTMYIKMSNNSFPSAFITQQDNKSDVGLDYGYRGNDADTLQGQDISSLTNLFISTSIIGAANGVAGLDKDGKVPTTQLPSNFGGGGFKTISLPNGDAINATTLASTLTLQATGGISFAKDVNNTLVIRYDDTLVQNIPQMKLDIQDTKDNLDLQNGRISTLESTVPNKADKTYVDNNFLKNSSTTAQSFTSDVSFSGNSDFTGTSTFDGEATFNKNVTFDRTIDDTTSTVNFNLPTDFNNTTNFNKNVTFNRAVDDTTSTVNFNLPTDFDNTTSFNKDVTFNRAVDDTASVANFNLPIIANKSVVLNDTTSFNKDVTFNRFAGDTTSMANFNLPIAANKSVVLNDTTSFNKDVTFNRLAGDTTSVANFKLPITASNTATFNNDVTFTRYEEKIGTATNGACDLSTGSIFNMNIAANTTISFTNASYTNSYVQSLVLYLNFGATSYTITFPANVKWHNATPPSAFTVNKIYELVFRTKDNGANWLATIGGTY